MCAPARAPCPSGRRAGRPDRTRLWDAGRRTTPEPVSSPGAPPTGVVFDPGSLVGEPERPPALALADLDGLVRHVHVKNRDAAGRGGEAQARPLGDGRVDWHEALRCLAAAGYGGWLSIDHLSASPSSAVLRRDVAALRRLIAASADHSNGGAHDG